MTPEEIAQAAARIIRKHLGPEYRVFLFGSRATGTARRGSDYDIGFEGPRPVELSTLFSIKEEIDELPTLASIDVVDFFDVTPEFRRIAMLAVKDL